MEQIKIIISGANGKMGKKVFDAVCQNQKTIAICGVDLKEDFSNKNFPIYSSLNDVKEKADVLIDFSSPASLDGILDYILKNNVKAVLCSTGYTAEQIEKINKASEKTAIFRSANMSLGANVLIKLVKDAVSSLSGFDIEIIEKHHNQKVDAPSGTAIMIADGIKEVANEKFYVYGRDGIVGKRDKNEIGIHAVRGGNIVGEHEVLFASENETITLYHQATDRAVFANGAIKAAIFIKDKTSGIYNMNDVINGK